MVTVTACETFPYAGVIRRARQSFEATEEDARILVLAGKASIRERPAPDPVGADDELSTDQPTPAVTRKRYSRRKDIVPES